jgi:alginate O-acetyltransferase complex protein AlgI
VFFLYWFVTNKSLGLQNCLLLISSYFFYACWDWRFLFLLLFSTLLDFYSGIRMSVVSGAFARKFWFWLSILINLGFLAVFKYYNFFLSSLAAALSHTVLHFSPWTLKVILPIGISFYTFHGLSYVIDVYKGRIKAERNFIDYAVFVSFFPLLVAGPIERATHLLPQVKQRRYFDYAKAVDGLRQILWGLFKKMVIADQCAGYANDVFNQSVSHSSSTLVMGAIFFAFQIYADFSGYSDIAIGTARLFGIELLRNFAFPYFSRDIAEFWRRWHISLSSWFKDYLYIPLGGSRCGTEKKIRNTFIIFLASGFWHGANWTFLAWGALNALYFLPIQLTKNNRNHLDTVAHGRLFPSAKEFFSILVTFALTVFAWIFFRSDTLIDAIHYISGIFKSPGSWFILSTYRNLVENYKSIIFLLMVFIVIEWLGRENKYAMEGIGKLKSQPVRFAVYFLVFVSILLLAGGKQEFIYFQF